MNKNGIAIWAKTQDDRSFKPIELHVNVWKPITKTSPCCFDVGVMFDCPAGGVEISIYFPVSNITIDNFEDLGNSLSKASMCSTVFNEVCKISDTAPNKIIEAKKINSETNTFFIYKLSQGEDVSILQKFDGTVIQLVIDKKVAFEKDNLYIRFRICSFELGKLFTRENLSHSILQNYTSCVEMFDLRINEIRILDTDLYSELTDNIPIRFKKVQFFFMCRSIEEVVLAKRSQNSARKLERSNWIEYAPFLKELNHNKEVLAYQWKKECEDPGCSDFSIFIKTKYDNLSRGKALLFGSIALLMGIAASLIASWFLNLACPQNYEEEIIHIVNENNSTTQLNQSNGQE